MKKTLVVFVVAAVASLGLGGMLTSASSRPIIKRDPCNGPPQLQQVEPGTTGDLNGDGRICVTDL